MDSIYIDNTWFECAWIGLNRLIIYYEDDQEFKKVSKWLEEKEA